MPPAEPHPRCHAKEEILRLAASNRRSHAACCRISYFAVSDAASDAVSDAAEEVEVVEEGGLIGSG
ncbi:hypothetical protein GCM10022381_20620 [Leifsonia kafniensis]|uniref:Uncharacterized protein n=1 Tax=Leifsonia kafniensis TaxID=475957 RepID=A0ABP7KKG2_9MICO